MKYLLTGTVSTKEGTPIKGASVSIVSSREISGAESSDVEIAWTRKITDFSGNRWQCWEEHVRSLVKGITWGMFKQAVLNHNPVLVDDDYVFKGEKTYLLPVNERITLYKITTTADENGRYTFDNIPAAGEYHVEVQAPGYQPHRNHLTIQLDRIYEVSLTSTEAGIKSDWAGYYTATTKIQKNIQQALLMLGDDTVAFDKLPPNLQRLAWGFNFRNDSSHMHHKDIVCADLVTICLAAAGVDFNWDVTEPSGSEYRSSHAANYYRPSGNNPKIKEIPKNEQWLPGDIIIYWNGDMANNRLRHVNLYTGPFSGIDNNGKHHPASRGYDVVNASIDYMRDETEHGTGIRPLTLEYCRNRRFGREHWARVRVLELEHEYSA